MRRIPPMGVGYGAASLWQWRLHPNEPGHEPYFIARGTLGGARLLATREAATWDW